MEVSVVVMVETSLGERTAGASLDNAPEESPESARRQPFLIESGDSSCLWTSR